MKNIFRNTTTASDRNMATVPSHTLLVIHVSRFDCSFVSCFLILCHSLTILKEQLLWIMFSGALIVPMTTSSSQVMLASDWLILNTIEYWSLIGWLSLQPRTSLQHLCLPTEISSVEADLVSTQPPQPQQQSSAGWSPSSSESFLMGMSLMEMEQLELLLISTVLDSRSDTRSKHADEEKLLCFLNALE